ncbi:hypothetical protein BDV29DRAFT_184281 [Aspergillus leporis]|uniref:Uncharacterized protein n=1 Tax=Aspergillus leporis TaxID=41062 RepID=A0A5N5WNH8_9EURO|nr:hypothetical protein BDV29DRAFT_184281 [Aspergillus leporis]
MNQSSIQIQLRTLLKLQYHDTMINLHRVFIEFPSHPLLPYSSPRVEAHVATALKQALATIRTVHNSTAEHDIFLVSGEIRSVPDDRLFEYIDLALETFEFAGPQNDAAVWSFKNTNYAIRRGFGGFQFHKLPCASPSPTRSCGSWPVVEIMPKFKGSLTTSKPSGVANEKEKKVSHMPPGVTMGSMIIKSHTHRYVD